MRGRPTGKLAGQTRLTVYQNGKSNDPLRPPLWTSSGTKAFANASARTFCRLGLADGAVACGWDMHMLGRIASAESWDTGLLRAASEFVREDG
ncbi:MAG TPA: urease accessory protein UreD, partial [Chthoniobacterales bacterium]|nr:urease accessory protein UreD [Chthoniobacterales bacterium]